MIHEFYKPIPCVTPLGDGFMLYVTTNGYLENDEITVILKKDGRLRHFTTADVRIYYNATYGIEKAKPLVPPVEDSPEVALQRQVEAQADLHRDLDLWADLRGLRRSLGRSHGTGTSLP